MRRASTTSSKTCGFETPPSVRMCHLPFNCADQVHSLTSYSAICLLSSGHLELAAARLASPDKDVEGSKGFFIGCGFHKPHVPFVFPAEFLQHFPEDLDDIPLADDTYAPIGMPDAAWHYPADVHGFPIKFNGTCNETRSRNFRRGCAFDRCLRPPLPSFSSLSALSASNLSASDCDAVIVIVAWAHLSVCRFTRMS